MTDLGLIITYIMIAAAIIACIASPIIQLKNHPEKIKQMMMPLLLLIGIFIFSTLISSNDVLPTYTNSDGALISTNLSKVVGGCLITFYVLAMIAIGSVLYSEVLHKLFKNGKK
tara:strand:+ start:1676 stop:2017 length:342 start_codon:yes stop_codon:yes gene_type:complete